MYLCFDLMFWSLLTFLPSKASSYKHHPFVYTKTINKESHKALTVTMPIQVLWSEYPSYLVSKIHTVDSHNSNLQGEQETVRVIGSLSY